MKKPEIEYSEPVREIMGSPPGAILRWGTTIIFAVFVLFILFARIIRYPDLVPSPVEITTENPPATIMSKTTGRIMHLFVADKQQVKKGKVLAVMENPALYSDIVKLKIFTDTFTLNPGLTGKRIPDLTGLGELQTSWETFSRSMADAANFYKNDFYGEKIKAVTEELRELNIYTAKLNENEKFYSENCRIELNKFRRDSMLNAGKSIAPADYENSRQALLRQQIDLQKVRLEISAKNMEALNKKQLIREYRIKRDEESVNLFSAASEALKNLKADLSIWENRYLLVSPVDGVVTFTKYWSENQMVGKDEAVMSVVPETQGNYIGKVFLKMHKSGKVKEGQTVYIKLNGYPYMEYGMVQGKIRTKSLVPAGDSYLIEIELKNGLTTLYGRTLEFTQNMTGVAEIITDDRSLLEKMIFPFRYLVSRNKR